MKLSLDELYSLKNELLLNRKKVDELLKSNKIVNYHDLLGFDDSNLIFLFLITKYSYLLDDSDRKAFSKEEIEKRILFNKIVQKIGPLFLKTKKIYEYRNELSGKNIYEDVKIPDEPVIFVANHCFHDDILGTILATHRHSYMMFGSLPQFYNTIDGLLLQCNGVILVNRKVKSNKKSSLDKAKMVLNNGASLIVFPEGVWNKSPNKLTLPLWNGVYRMASECGVKIVPIVHYIKDETITSSKKDNPFHTVIDDAIDVSGMSEEEVLNKISDSFNTWTYLMMEKYGKSSRSELVDGFDDSISAWEERLRLRLATADKYDIEIETKADYLPKNVVRPIDAFSPIAELDLLKYNAGDVLSAKKLVKEEKRVDFQHRF